MNEWEWTPNKLCFVPSLSVSYVTESLQFQSFQHLFARVDDQIMFVPDKGGYIISWICDLEADLREPIELVTKSEYGN